MKYKTVKRMRHVGMCRCEVKIDQLCNQHSLSAKHIFASSISFHSDCQWVPLSLSLWDSGREISCTRTHTYSVFICHLRKKTMVQCTDWMKLSISLTNAIDSHLWKVYKIMLFLIVTKIAWHQIICCRIFYSLN